MPLRAGTCNRAHRKAAVACRLGQKSGRISRSGRCCCRVRQAASHSASRSATAGGDQQCPVLLRIPDTAGRHPTCRAPPSSQGATQLARRQDLWLRIARMHLWAASIAGRKWAPCTAGAAHGGSAGRGPEQEAVLGVAARATSKRAVRAATSLSSRSRCWAEVLWSAPSDAALPPPRSVSCRSGLLRQHGRRPFTACLLPAAATQPQSSRLPDVHMVRS